MISEQAAETIAMEWGKFCRHTDLYWVRQGNADDPACVELVPKTDNESLAMIEAIYALASLGLIVLSFNRRAVTSTAIVMVFKVSHGTRKLPRWFHIYAKPSDVNEDPSL